MSEHDGYRLGEENGVEWVDDYGDGWSLVLPHQCGDWKIGTADQARLLVDDLIRLIASGPMATEEGWCVHGSIGPHHYQTREGVKQCEGRLVKHESL